MRTMRTVERLGDLRVVGVLYLWGVGSSLAVFAFATTHPLGVIYELITALGAIALFGLPSVDSARLRSALVALAAFVIMLQAFEWARLVPWPVGPATAILWLTALVGVIATVSSDAEINVASKLPIGDGD